MCPNKLGQNYFVAFDDLYNITNLCIVLRESYPCYANWHVFQTNYNKSIVGARVPKDFLHMYTNV